MFFRENGRRTALTAAAAILLAAAGPLSAQDPPTAVLDILKLPRTERIVIRRVAGPIALDGRIDEPGWAGLLPLCLVMQTPTFGEACSERTEALLGYDDEFIYVAGRLLDREPDKIQAPTRKRDAMVATSDWFGVLFDSFNDKENSLAFFTTPAGLRFDAAVFRDGQLGTTQDMPMNLSWNTFWDVAVARSGEGWFVEMRIPLSSLRFQAQGGDVVMGVTVFRWISRRNETDVFPAIPKNWGDMSAWKPSQAQETVWPGLRPRRPVYLTPYVLTGYEHTYELNDDETAYLEASGPKLELGLDFKYGLTGNLTFDATVNPDFAQVEADDVQVNLTRFSLFFPEKRLFFQERSSNFDYNMGGTEHALLQPPDRARRRRAGPHLRRRPAGRTARGVGCRLPRYADGRPRRHAFGELRRPAPSPPGHQSRIPISAGCSPAGWASTGVTASITASIGSGAWPATTTSPSNGPRPSRTGRRTGPSISRRGASP